MSYTDTFIQIAPDSPVDHSVVPVAKGAKKPLHLVQYELLTARPYHYTHEDLVFAVHLIRQGIDAEQESPAHIAALRAEFFKKGHPCLRASALTKRYGWGAHYNGEGKIALFPAESEEYQQFVDALHGTRQLLSAMRSKRA